MVDIEADGPIPGDYSMICFGAVVVEPSLSRTFYRQLRPISDCWIPEALAVSGFTASASVQISLADNNNGTETVTLRDTTPVTPATPRFVRLRIEQN